MTKKTAQGESQKNSEIKSQRNNKKENSISHHNGLILLGFFFMLAISTVAVIFSVYCFIEMNNLKNSQNEIMVSEDTNEDIVVDSKPNTQPEEGIAISVANAMLEELTGACAEKTDADKMMMLSMDVTIKNNSQNDIELSAYQSGTNNKWTLLGDNVDLKTYDYLSGQSGDCNWLALQYRRPSKENMQVMTNDNYFYVSEGGLSLQSNVGNNGLMLLKGEEATMKLYLSLNRNIDISNLSLQYQMGDIKAVSNSFGIALESRDIYKAMHGEK